MVYPEEPKVYVLFQFPEKSPGIGKLCCVFKPGVPEDQSDATTLLTSWIDTKKPLVIRYFIIMNPLTDDNKCSFLIDGLLKALRLGI